MIKKIVGIAMLIILSLSVAIATVFADSQTNQKEYFADISYNYITYSGGDIKIFLQAYYNVQTLYKNKSVGEQEIIEAEVDESLKHIESLFLQNNYEAEYKDGYVEILLKHYSSYTDMYIDNQKNSSNDSEDTSKSQVTEKMGFLFNTVTTKTKTPFYNMSENSIVHTIAKELSTIDNVEGSIRYVYNYGTRYSFNVIKSESEKSFEKNGVYIHSFYMDDNSLNRDIVLIQITPNTLVWYGFVIVFAVVFVAVVIILIKLKKPKEKTEG